ncbi:NADPH-dependent diflavin oxidoreductase 1 [Varanus komodoensis]|nr:NADPH-dependent diflavin oxidoreductase 1 [Varanus komodoensis]
MQPDAVIDPWLSSLWKKILDLYPLPSGLRILSPDIILPPKYTFQFLDEASAEAPLPQEEASRGPPSELRPFLARMVSNQRVTSELHFQDVRLIECAAGDVVMIQPCNPPEEVQLFCQLLRLDPDMCFVVRPAEPDTPLPAFLPQPCTIRYLLLSYFSPNELEREKLQEFSSAEGQEDLHAYCNRPRRTLLEARPDRIEILVAVVQYKTGLVQPRRGLCSTWLASLNPQNGAVRVPVWAKRGSMTFPAEPHTPVILIGPGTGVAPFRAAIQERAAQGKKENYLFFGCRQKSKDFYCQAEWEALVQRGFLTLFVAFSRDQEEKVYVQHRIRENKVLVWDLLRRGAHVYLAG